MESGIITLENNMEKHVEKLYTPEIYRQAAERFGFRPEGGQRLDGFENYLYELRRDGRDYVLRLSHSSKKQVVMIESELDYLAYLSRGGAPVTVPVPSLSGRLTEPISASDGSSFTAVLFEKAPGRHPQGEDFGEPLYRTWGRTLGRIHSLAQGYHPSRPEYKRMEWDEEPEVVNPQRFLSGGHERFIERYFEVVEALRQLPTGPQTYGMIHNDAHSNNFLYDGQKITIIDWEDAVYAWYASELAICLFTMTVYPPGGDAEAFTRRFWPVFVAGYREEKALSDDWMEHMPLFLKLREFGQYVAIYRGADMDNLDPWPKHFMRNRKERLEEGVPYLNLDFTSL